MWWQRELIRKLYGTIEIDTGLRQYHVLYASMAKKNGKTFVVGGMPLYHLAVEGIEFEPLVIGAASAKRQASLVFKAASSLIKPNPRLREAFKVVESQKRIVHRKTNAHYEVFAADGDVNDGEGPSLLIMDELHRWKNAKHETNADTLRRGTRARREPLTVMITTAGEKNECPMWHREHEYARRVLSGSLKSDRYYAAIWEANPDRMREDPEYWKTEQARIEANPSHEHYGGFLKDEMLREDLAKAIADPVEQRKYERYTLNTEVDSETRYIPAADWKKCARPLRPLLGRPCWAGVDLGSTSDMCALVLVFPDADGTFDVQPFFWVPTERIAELERKTRQPYHRWIRDERLIPVEGNAVTYSSVIEKVLWCKQEFDLREVCYDPWHAEQMAKELTEKHGAVCVRIPQGYAHLTETTKKVAALIADGKIRHNSHPILDWHADSATVKSDGKDNVMLAKPDRNASVKRIDGMAAIVNAFVRALAYQDRQPSFLKTGTFASL